MTNHILTWEDVHSRIFEISLSHRGELLDSPSHELDHRKSIYVVAERMRTMYDLPSDAYKVLQNCVYITPPLENSICEYMTHWTDVYIFNYYENIHMLKVKHNITEDLISAYDKIIYNLVEDLKKLPGIYQVKIKTRKFNSS
jgi:hypothetical protein